MFASCFYTLSVYFSASVTADFLADKKKYISYSCTAFTGVILRKQVHCGEALGVWNVRRCNSWSSQLEIASLKTVQCLHFCCWIKILFIFLLLEFMSFRDLCWNLINNLLPQCYESQFVYRPSSYWFGNRQLGWMLNDWISIDFRKRKE